MLTNESVSDVQFGENPIQHALHEVEHAFEDAEFEHSHKAPLSIFCVISMLSAIVLVYRLLWL